MKTLAKLDKAAQKSPHARERRERLEAEIRQWVETRPGDRDTVEKLRSRLSELPDMVSSSVEPPAENSLSFSNVHLMRLPHCIGEFRSISRLTFSDVNLMSVPHNIGDLRFLDTLNLSNNHLTEIPGSVANLSNLRVLNIQGNAIGSLPNMFDRLGNLRTLDVSRNRLRGLPESLGQTRIRNMDLSRNPLTSFPRRFWFTPHHELPNPGPRTTRPSLQISLGTMSDQVRNHVTDTLGHLSYVHFDMWGAVRMENDAQYVDLVDRWFSDTQPSAGPDRSASASGTSSQSAATLDLPPAPQNVREMNVGSKFCKFLNRLRALPTYENAATRPMLARRVSNLLTHMASDPAIKSVLVQYVISEEVLQTCTDRAALGLSGLEVMVRHHQIEQSDGKGLKEIADYLIGEQRLLMVEQAIGEEVIRQRERFAIDEVEIGVHIQTALREELNLPINMISEDMRHLSMSRVTDERLREIARDILATTGTPEQQAEILAHNPAWRACVTRMLEAQGTHLMQEILNENEKLETLFEEQDLPLSGPEYDRAINELNAYPYRWTASHVLGNAGTNVEEPLSTGFRTTVQDAVRSAVGTARGAVGDASAGATEASRSVEGTLRVGETSAAIQAGGEEEIEPRRDLFPRLVLPGLRAPSDTLGGLFIPPDGQEHRSAATHSNQPNRHATPHLQSPSTTPAQTPVASIAVVPEANEAVTASADLGPSPTPVTPSQTVGSLPVNDTSGPAQDPGTRTRQVEPLQETATTATKANKPDVSSETIPEYRERIRNNLQAWVDAAPQEQVARTEVQRQLLQTPIGGPSLRRVVTFASLVIEGGRLTSLPDCIGDFGSLTEIRIRNARLQNLPESLGDLFRLTHLDLGENQLSTLPSSIVNFTHLRELRVDGNRLTELPDIFDQFAALRVFSAQNNLLCTPPDSLERIQLHHERTSPTTIDLSGNPLTSMSRRLAWLKKSPFVQLQYSTDAMSPHVIREIDAMATSNRVRGAATSAPIATLPAAGGAATGGTPGTLEPGVEDAEHLPFPAIVLRWFEDVPPNAFDAPDAALPHPDQSPVPHAVRTMPPVQGLTALLNRLQRLPSYDNALTRQVLAARVTHLLIQMAANPQLREIARDYLTTEGSTASAPDQTALDFNALEDLALLQTLPESGSEGLAEIATELLGQVRVALVEIASEQEVKRQLQMRAIDRVEVLMHIQAALQEPLNLPINPILGQMSEAGALSIPEERLSAIATRVLAATATREQQAHFLATNPTWRLLIDRHFAQTRDTASPHKQEAENPELQSADSAGQTSGNRPRSDQRNTERYLNAALQILGSRHGVTVEAANSTTTVRPLEADSDRTPAFEPQQSLHATTQPTASAPAELEAPVEPAVLASGADNSPQGAPQTAPGAVSGAVGEPEAATEKGARPKDRKRREALRGDAIPRPQPRNRSPSPPPGAGSVAPSGRTASHQTTQANATASTATDAAGSRQRDVRPKQSSSKKTQSAHSVHGPYGFASRRTNPPTMRKADTEQWEKRANRTDQEKVRNRLKLDATLFSQSAVQAANNARFENRRERAYIADNQRPLSPTYARPNRMAIAAAANMPPALGTRTAAPRPRPAPVTVNNPSPNHPTPQTPAPAPATNPAEAENNETPLGDPNNAVTLEDIQQISAAMAHPSHGLAGSAPTQPSYSETAYSQAPTTSFGPYRPAPPSTYSEETASTYAPSVFGYPDSSSGYADSVNGDLNWRTDPASRRNVFQQASSQNHHFNTTPGHKSKR